MAEVSDDTRERRRGQLRQAQRTHRARKAVYVKALEAEVTELREQNAVYRRVIEHLQETLQSNGIPVPEFPTQSGDSGSMTRIDMIGNEPGEQIIQAFMPSREMSTRSCSSMASDPPTNQAQDQADNLDPASSNQVEAGSSSYAHPQGLDSDQVAVSFVLALEQPCIPHHGEQSTELLEIGLTGTGHEKMLSTPILSRSTLATHVPSEADDASGAQWTVPTAALETLLRYSDKLPLGEEVTPIQIWNFIRQSPNFNDITFSQLELLGQELLPLIECFGFGAVIKQPLFKEAFERICPAI